MDAMFYRKVLGKKSKEPGLRMYSGPTAAEAVHTWFTASASDTRYLLLGRWISVSLPSREPNDQLQF